MNKNITWKVFLVVMVCAWGVYYSLPNLIGNEDKANKGVKKYKFLPNVINYGLDIQGGLHLVMGVDVNEVISESLHRFGSTVKDKAKEKNVEIANISNEKVDGADALMIETKNAADIESLKQVIEKDFNNLQIVKTDGSKIEVRYLDNYIRDLKKKTVEQSIETIRNRVDEFGVSEPSITAQGDDRILIQLPGLKDALQAKELINKTARLEFMIVSKEAATPGFMSKVADAIQKGEKDGGYSLQSVKYSEYIKKINADLLKSNALPKNTKLLFQKAENAESMTASKVPYVVETGLGLTGEDLKSATTGYGEYGEPEVSLSFTSTGASKFADVTGTNIGRQMAVVLDDVVYTAPNIKDRIGGGNARITLGRGTNYDSQLKEANLISMALRAGALPAKLDQLEERTVGPSLGADSITSAQKAVTAGVILIAIFMMFYYKTMGVIAIVSLLFNGVLILATLTSFGATLTLPGIAGIGLTLGMAIDANVIIYERIREELRKGMDIVSAVNEGFNRAMSAIVDANLVVAATSAILMYYGTGPVRGFGLTLLIGIATTLFTAVFMTRTVVEFLIYKLNVRKLSV